MTIEEQIAAMRAAVEAGYYPLSEYIRFVREHRREGMSLTDHDLAFLFRREGMSVIGNPMTKDELWAEIERLRAEIERLRAVLMQIAVHVARAAINDDRPAYVKPSIREIKFSKGSTTS